MTPDNLQGRGPKAMKGLEVRTVPAVHVAHALLRRLMLRVLALSASGGVRTSCFLQLARPLRLDTVYWSEDPSLPPLCPLPYCRA